MHRLAIRLLLLVPLSLAAASASPAARSASLPASLAQGWTMSRLQPSAAAVPGPKDGAAMVVRGGPGFVAFGQSFSGPPPLWVSPDGRTWQTVPIDTRVFRPSDTITSLTAVRGTVLALGVHQPPLLTSTPLPPRATTVARWPHLAAGGSWSLH